MKSLRVVQGFAKVGRVLSLIVFIFSIIGAVSCAVGLIFMLAFQNVDAGNGQTIAQVIEQETKMPMFVMYANVICSIIVCGVEIVLAKMAQRYFEYEIKQGTPFTFDGASKMLKLGIWCLVAPFVASIICAIVYAIYASIHGEFNTDSLVGFSGASGVGIAFIVISFILKYGADVKKTADMAMGISENEVNVDGQVDTNKEEEKKEEIIVNEEKNTEEDKDVFDK